MINDYKRGIRQDYDKNETFNSLDIRSCPALLLITSVSNDVF
jgi:hypothetical protein